MKDPGCLESRDGGSWLPWECGWGIQDALGTGMPWYRYKSPWFPSSRLGLESPRVCGRAGTQVRDIAGTLCGRGCPLYIISRVGVTLSWVCEDPGQLLQPHLQNPHSQASTRPHLNTFQPQILTWSSLITLADEHPFVYPRQITSLPLLLH